MDFGLETAKLIREGVERRIRESDRTTLLFELFAACSGGAVLSWGAHQFFFSQNFAVHLTSWVGALQGGLIYGFYLSTRPEEPIADSSTLTWETPAPSSRSPLSRRERNLSNLNFLKNWNQKWQEGYEDFKRGEEGWHALSRLPPPRSLDDSTVPRIVSPQPSNPGSPFPAIGHGQNTCWLASGVTLFSPLVKVPEFRETFTTHPTLEWAKAWWDQDIALWIPFRTIYAKIAEGASRISVGEIEAAHRVVFPYLSGGAFGGFQDPSEAFTPLLNALPVQLRSRVGMELEQISSYPADARVIEECQNRPSERDFRFQSYPNREALDGELQLVTPPVHERIVSLPVNCGSIQAGIVSLFSPTAHEGQHTFCATVGGNHYFVTAQPRVERKLINHPDLLPIQIQRYDLFGRYLNTPIEANRRIELPGNCFKNGQGASYRLTSFSRFSGAHHTCYVRWGTQWWYMNDLSQESRPAGISPFHEAREAYLLLYIRSDLLQSNPSGASSST